MTYMHAENVMECYRDGDEMGWPHVLQWLWTEHRKQMLKLMDSVFAEGFREPILLGRDYRVWDGHHRLAIALTLGLRVPVKMVGGEENAPNQ